MRFNYFLKFFVVCMLLAEPLSVLAMNEQIKCPSADFLKAKFTNALNQVTRVDINKFTVKYWDNVFDAESNRYWSIEIFADTAHDYDFNEAYKNAQATLTTVAHPQWSYINTDQSYCNYVDENENPLMVLAFFAKENKKPL